MRMLRRENHQPHMPGFDILPGFRASCCTQLPAPVTYWSVLQPNPGEEGTKNHAVHKFLYQTCCQRRKRNIWKPLTNPGVPAGSSGPMIDSLLDFMGIFAGKIQEALEWSRRRMVFQTSPTLFGWYTLYCSASHI